MGSSIHETIHQLLTNEDTLIFVIGGTLGLAGIIFGTVSSMVKNTARERSRREIAAYIAEGSMSPEQGERLMRAKPDED